jgi:hypothetical protein
VSVTAINLESKPATFRDHWQSRTVGQFNGHDPATAASRRVI